MVLNSHIITKSLGWKLAERFGVQGVQFVLQIILARLLNPEYYGMLSMMIVFTTLANVFIQTGFSTSLIQNKEVTEDDYSSVFWVTIGTAVIIYTGLFFAAPYIASFYNMPEIVYPFRVLALILLPGSLNSIQFSKISREMDFKKSFISNIYAVTISGIIGIILAYLNAGFWALVVQTVLSIVVVCVVMWFTVKWRPKLICDIKRVKVLFTFGWKLLISSLLDTLFLELQSLIIGKKYDSGTLGYYNRGKQFPQFIVSSVNSTLQSVMLPAMAKEQDEKAKVKELMRNSLTLSAFIIFPIMAGLASVATPLVSLLLTDKWLPCVPYLRIYCFVFAFYPIFTCNLQAINAMGRSDIFLKLEIVKKAFSLAAIIIAVIFFDSPIAIAISGAITILPSFIINAFPNKKLIGYSYFEQIIDILPSLIVALVMSGIVLVIEKFAFGHILTLVIQVFIGALTYVGLSAIFKLKPFTMLIKLIKAWRAKRKVSSFLGL